MIKIEYFKTYLQEQDKQSEKSIKEHLLNMQRFITWAETQNYSDIQHITYTELLSYIQHEKQRGIKVQTVKLKLNTLKKYYEYLKHIGIIDKNPTKKINLKGVQKTVTQNIFSYTELEQLYTDYLNLKPEIKNNQATPFVKHRNNIILGLMIWQGAVSGEIEKITLEHLNLDQGTIYIPKCRRGAGRELKLFPKQIIQLYQYINETRTKLNPKADELIIGYVDNHVYRLMQELKGINQKVHSASQLRTSIIIHWIKVYGKRQAQYMAGHKYISSTEKFELQEIDTLTDTLLKHHLFG
jgi:site-specific recombinase XerD